MCPCTFQTIGKHYDWMLLQWSFDSCQKQLALSAASPVQRGYLSDVDCRWNVIAASVDDRTKEERGLEVKHHFQAARAESGRASGIMLALMYHEPLCNPNCSGCEPYRTKWTIHKSANRGAFTVIQRSCFCSFRTTPVCWWRNILVLSEFRNKSCLTNLLVEILKKKRKNLQERVASPTWKLVQIRHGKIMFNGRCLFQPLKNDRFVINKSRYDSIDSYLSPGSEKYNDIYLTYDTEIYQQLKDAGLWKRSCSNWAVSL